MKLSSGDAIVAALKVFECNKRTKDFQDRKVLRRF